MRDVSIPRELPPAVWENQEVYNAYATEFPRENYVDSDIDGDYQLVRERRGAGRIRVGNGRRRREGARISRQR